MTDKALASHPEFVQVLSEWDAWPSATDAQRVRRREHIRRELARVETEGVCPLFAALTVPLGTQVDACVEALEQSAGTVWLRLVEGAQPPDRDPQGRPLPEALRGKILRAKLGNIGHADATVRQTTSQQNQPVIRTVDIGHAPVPVSFREAILVLRQWGYRVRPTEHRSTPAGPVSAWIVVVVRDGHGSVYEPAVEAPSEPVRARR